MGVKAADPAFSVHLTPVYLLTMHSPSPRQYYLYNTLFVRWCGSITRIVGSRGSAPVMTFIDQALQ